MNKKGRAGCHLLAGPALLAAVATSCLPGIDPCAQLVTGGKYTCAHLRSRCSSDLREAACLCHYSGLALHP